MLPFLGRVAMTEHSSFPANPFQALERWLTPKHRLAIYHALKKGVQAARTHYHSELLLEPEMIRHSSQSFCRYVNTCIAKQLKNLNGQLLNFRVETRSSQFGGYPFTVLIIGPEEEVLLTVHKSCGEGSLPVKSKYKISLSSCNSAHRNLPLFPSLFGNYDRGVTPGIHDHILYGCVTFNIGVNFPFERAEIVFPNASFTSTIAPSIALTDSVNAGMMSWNNVHQQVNEMEGSQSRAVEEIQEVDLNFKARPERDIESDDEEDNEVG